MSKLDEAFLKAYAKVRDTGRRQVAASPSEVSPVVVPEVWSDDEGEILIRADEGVVNVASFIARTPNGRTRGTAPRPHGGVAENDVPRTSPNPENHSEPEYDLASIQVIDEGHAVRGPHFQPISLDLAALDVFAPAASATIESARHIYASVAVGHDAAAGHQIDTLETIVVSQAMAGSSARDRNAGGRSRGAQPTAKDLAEQHVSDYDPEDGFSSGVITDNVQASATAMDLAVDVAPSIDSHPTSVEPPRVIVRADNPHQASSADRVSVVDSVVAEEDTHGPVSAKLDAIEKNTEKVLAEFAAAWEVDRFEFEEIVWDLSAESSPLWQAAEQLEIACHEGLKVLAVTSPSRGQGRSTLSITLARMLAATGLNVALLDGDIDRPSLADKMRLEIRLGWGDAVRTGLSVEEVAVQSVEDGFTVLPSASPDAGKGLRPAADTTTAMMSQLRDAFDLIVIDTANVNVVGGWIPGADDGQIDAALVIQDLRNDDPDAMQACLRRLQKIGVANIGLVENFATA